MVMSLVFIVTLNNVLACSCYFFFFVRQRIKIYHDSNFPYNISYKTTLFQTIILKSIHVRF